MGSLDVWLIGFAADADDPVHDLMQLFSISEERARRLIDAMPVAVKKKTTQEVASRFSRKLEKIGAEVEVRATGGGETSDTFAVAPSRTARRVAPSRSRTGRGLDPDASSPSLPALDDERPGTLPKRRSAAAMPAVTDGSLFRKAESSSPSMKALGARPPSPRRRHSAARMAAIASGELPSGELPSGGAASEGRPPRRGSKPTMPAESAVVAESIREDPVDDDVPSSKAARPRRQNATAVLGSAVAQPRTGRGAVVGTSSAPPAEDEPGQRARKVGAGRSFPPAPPDVDEQRPRSFPPAPPDAPRHPGRLPGAPDDALDLKLPRPPAKPRLDVAPPRDDWEDEDIVNVPRLPSGVPAPLSAAPPPMSGAPPGTTSGLRSRPPSAPPPKLEPQVPAAPVPVPTAVPAAGVQVPAGLGRYIIGGGVLVLILVVWRFTVGAPEEKVAGGLDARIEVLNRIADACERTASDEPSCEACCEGGMVFDEICECTVPWRCREGDDGPDACSACCGKDGARVSSRHLPKQGCVCNMDPSLYQ